VARSPISPQIDESTGRVVVTKVPLATPAGGGRRPCRPRSPRHRELGRQARGPRHHRGHQCGSRAAGARVAVLTTALPRPQRDRRTQRISPLFVPTFVRPKPSSSSASTASNKENKENKEIREKKKKKEKNKKKKKEKKKKEKKKRK
jgi:hypothetical protein